RRLLQALRCTGECGAQLELDHGQARRTGCRIERLNGKGAAADRPTVTELPGAVGAPAPRLAVDPCTRVVPHARVDGPDPLQRRHAPGVPDERRPRPVLTVTRTELAAVVAAPARGPSVGEASA